MIEIKNKLITCILFALLIGSGNPIKASSPTDMIEGTMTFKVSTLLDGYGTRDKPISDQSFQPIHHARLLVINSDGQIAANGLTDEKGEWKVKITTPIDPLFSSKKMGLVTVIAVADGFNEFIAFGVPVNEHGNGEGGAFVMLKPLDPKDRNEPRFDARLHRFTVFDILDAYANKAGLVKQKPVEGYGLTEEEMPWSSATRHTE